MKKKLLALTSFFADGGAAALFVAIYVLLLIAAPLFIGIPASIVIGDIAGAVACVPVALVAAGVLVIIVDAGR